MNQTTRLDDRGVVHIGGEDACGFLQGLVTCDIEKVVPGAPGFGALLTPQGKILFDFFVYADDDGYLIDCRADMVTEFVKRLTFYKLRAKVEIVDCSGIMAVVAAWGKDISGPTGELSKDPRLAALGLRGIVNAGDEGRSNAGLKDYHIHRVALGVPEGGVDFAYGDVFPHEADMDYLNGVSFTKGCYIGQEVVSRIENRGTARTRMVKVTAMGDMPASGAAIMAGDKNIGTLGPGIAQAAIGTLRIDRLEAAISSGATISADGVPLAVEIPVWADFAGRDAPEV